jgi:hypothetical protein
MNEIYAAEGSDWFWWYGDDFVTDNDLIFDELFRTHLQNVYNICGVPVPDVLKTTICRSEVTHETRKPTDLITPTIDGQITSYYEWIGAGLYEAGRAMGAMYRTERFIDAVHFGTDLERFYLRVDFRKDVELPARGSVRVNIVQPRHHALIVSKLRPGRMTCELWETDPEGSYKKLEAIKDSQFERIIEVGVPFEVLGWRARDQVAFFVQLVDGEVELERHPEMGTLGFAVPDVDFEVENWRV